MEIYVELEHVAVAQLEIKEQPVTLERSSCEGRVYVFVCTSFTVRHLTVSSILQNIFALNLSFLSPSSALFLPE